MHSLTLAVRQFILNSPEVKRVLVACSGGVDSTVLLHCVAKAELPLPVAAVHVNHQLSPHADAWQGNVQQLCAQLEVQCFAERVAVCGRGSGLEQAARQARYSAFDRHLRDGDLLLTAHHQQDQAETFFLRLCRGAGLRGLGAITPMRVHGPAQIGRPFLQNSKDQLLDYAQGHQLQWVEDESNQHEMFDRNFLRAQVFPLLQQRWPQVFRQVSQSAQLLQEAESLLSLYAQEDIIQCQPQEERVGVSLTLTPLMAWPEVRRNQVIRAWMARQGMRMPERKQFVELGRLLTAQDDKCPVLQWQDCEIRRFQQRLYCLPRHWQLELERSANEAKAQLLHNNHSHLEVVPGEEGLQPDQNYTVALRKHCPEVTRAHPAGRKHSQTLKKLFQEYALEPWLRPWVPLVFCRGELVAVADLWLEASCVYRGKQAVAFRWQPGAKSDRV